MKRPATLRDVQVIGTGLWDGPPVENADVPSLGAPKTTKDPFKGKPDELGVVRIAGMELDATRYARTIAAIGRAFDDPFRGTRRRRFFPPDLKSSDAEAAAGRAALIDAGITSDDVDAVLVQSFIPDEVQPKNAALVAEALGIRNAIAWGVDSVCNSVISQMHVGSALIASGQADHVLCVVSTAYSRVADHGLSATVQEGDMAGAFVLARRAGKRIDFGWRVDGRLHAAIKLAWDAPTDAAPRAWWQPSRERLLIRFTPELQQQVMGELTVHMKELSHEVLARAEMPLESVDVVLSHQPMSWYGELMADTLALRNDVVFLTFEEYANINSASMAASMHHARKAGRIQEGSNVLFFCPAAGYVFGAAAVRW